MWLLLCLCVCGVYGQAIVNPYAVYEPRAYSAQVEPRVILSNDIEPVPSRRDSVPHTTHAKIQLIADKVFSFIRGEQDQMMAKESPIVMGMLTIAVLAYEVGKVFLWPDLIEPSAQARFLSNFGNWDWWENTREVQLPGLGTLGDAMNDVAEVALNMVTVYLYDDESRDCGSRLLCEASQQAHSRGVLNSLLNYVASFMVAWLLPDANLSDSLVAMRSGRSGLDCLDMYPTCPISL